MPDVDVVTPHGTRRAFEFLHGARPMLLNVGAPSALDVSPWASRVQLVDGSYEGEWELPVIGVVSAPTALLVRPDGYVAWAADAFESDDEDRLRVALTRWFGAEHQASVALMPTVT
jgi:3-(3-hydroxy-phenyl)propionate hydroxylase